MWQSDAVSMLEPHAALTSENDMRRGRVKVDQGLQSMNACCQCTVCMGSDLARRRCFEWMAKNLQQLLVKLEIICGRGASKQLKIGV